MILSDNIVKSLLQNKKIGIEPLPRETDWQGMALDGHLGNQFFKIRHKQENSHRLVVDLSRYKNVEFAKEFQVEVDLSKNGYYELLPHEFLLAYTKEKFKLPIEAKVCAFVEGKSGLARIGLGIHVSAPLMHCGMGIDSRSGIPIMLEIYNHSENIILLRPGDPICQFVFYEVKGDFDSPGVKTLGRQAPGHRD